MRGRGGRVTSCCTITLGFAPIASNAGGTGWGTVADITAGVSSTAIVHRRQHCQTVQGRTEGHTIQARRRLLWHC